MHVLCVRIWERTLEGTPWAKAKGSAVCTNGVDNGVDNLQCKSCTVLDATTILVGTRVGNVLGELVDEVAVRAVDLDTIESSAEYGVVRGCRVELDIFLDFVLGKGSRFLGTSTAQRDVRSTDEPDVGWRNTRTCSSASEGP